MTNNSKSENHIANILEGKFGWNNRSSDGQIDTVDKDFESGVSVRASFSSKDGTYLSLEILHDDDEAFSGGDLDTLAKKINAGVESIFAREQHLQHLIEDHKQSYKGIMTAFNVPREHSDSGNIAIEIVIDDSWHLTPFNKNEIADLHMGYRDDVLKEQHTFDASLTFGNECVWHHMNYVLIKAENRTPLPVFYLLNNSNRINSIPNEATGLIVYEDKPKEEIQVTFKLSLEIDEATDDSIFYNVEGWQELEKMQKEGQYGCDGWKLISYSLN